MNELDMGDGTPLEETNFSCMYEDTLVYTNYGIVPISTVSTGDMLWSGSRWGRVLSKTFSVLELNLIRTPLGDVKCTPDMQWSVFRKGMRREHVPTSELLPGDKLVYCRTIGEVIPRGYESRLPYDAHRIFTAPQSLNEKLAWFLGYIKRMLVQLPQRDGVRIACKDGTLCKSIVMDCLFELGMEESDFFVTGDLINIKSAALAEYIITLAGCNVTKIDNEYTEEGVPSWVMNATDKNRVAYAMGILDGNPRNKGNMPIFATCESSHKYITDLQALLTSIGIAALPIYEHNDGWGLSVGDDISVETLKIYKDRCSVFNEPFDNIVRSQFTYPVAWFMDYYESDWDQEYYKSELELGYVNETEMSDKWGCKASPVDILSVGPLCLPEYGTVYRLVTDTESVMYGPGFLS